LALVDLPIRDVKAGMFEAFRTCSFFPKPADIRKVAYSGEEYRKTQEYKALSEVSDPDIRKDNLAKIHAILDGIAERRDMSTPANDPEVLLYYEIGKTVIDHAAIEHARQEAIKAVRKRYSRKDNGTPNNERRSGRAG
jgi:hypothetical protein